MGTDWTQYERWANDAWRRINYCVHCEEDSAQMVLLEPADLSEAHMYYRCIKCGEEWREVLVFEEGDDGG